MYSAPAGNAGAFLFHGSNELMDYHAMNTGELRERIREQVRIGNSMMNDTNGKPIPGTVIVLLQKQECIDLLESRMTPNAVIQAVAARQTGATTPEAYNKAVDERMNEIIKTHTVESSKMDPITAAITSAIQQAIDQQEKQHEDEKNKLLAQIKELMERPIVPMGPTLAQCKPGETVTVAGRDLQAIGASGLMVPPLDPMFDPAKWAAGKLAGTLRFQHKLADVAELLVEGNTLWLYGPRGCGKTAAIEYICAKLGWPLVRVQGNKDLTVDDFVGCYVAEAGSTKWIDGPLAIAMKIGAVLLVDEVGRCPSDTTNILHGIAENNAKGLLTITAKGGEVVKPHINFRLVATDNSAGFGDTSGLYPDVRVQDAAFLDRFTIKAEVSYPTTQHETAILVNRTGIKKEDASLMVKVAQETRNAANAEQMVYALSTRALINWARISVKLGIPQAFALTIVNSVPESDQAVLCEIAQRVLGEKLTGAPIVTPEHATTTA